MIRRFRTFARQQLFVLVTGLVAGAFVVGGVVDPRRIPAIVDGRILLVLFSLLVSVELLRQSGYLDRMVAITVSRFHRARSFVLALVIVTGALSAVVTNDVALFIVIPFTIIARGLAEFRLENAVALEIVAANLLGALTPLGNPQNLYLYHLSGWSPWTFIQVMAPFAGAALLGLAVAVWIGESATRMSFVAPPPVVVHRTRGALGLLVMLLVIAEIGHLLPVWPATAAAAVCAALLLRSRLGDMGLSIVPLFFFAFVIVEGLRSLELYGAFDLIPVASQQLRLYIGVIAASQIISNVPAAVLFAPASEQQWSLMLMAANAGGCGTIIASLANLLGWRIWVREGGESRSFFRRLLLLNVIFLVWISLVGWFVW